MRSSFKLYYRRVCPLEVSEHVPSGVTDDNGVSHAFPGLAAVVQVNSQYAFRGGVESEATVEVCPPVT